MKDFSQSQCEALIDLLCLALSTDEHVSPVEELAAHVCFAKIGWHTRESRELYILDSLVRAGHAVENDKELLLYLADRTANFTTAAEKKKVMDHLIIAGDKYYSFADEGILG